MKSGVVDSSVSNGGGNLFAAPMRIDPPQNIPNPIDMYVDEHVYCFVDFHLSHESRQFASHAIAIGNGF